MPCRGCNYGAASFFAKFSGAKDEPTCVTDECCRNARAYGDRAAGVGRPPSAQSGSPPAKMPCWHSSMRGPEPRRPIPLANHVVVLRRVAYVARVPQERCRKSQAASIISLAMSIRRLQEA